MSETDWVRCVNEIMKEFGNVLIDGDEAYIQISMNEFFSTILVLSLHGGQPDVFIRYRFRDYSEEDMGMIKKKFYDALDNEKVLLERITKTVERLNQ